MLIACMFTNIVVYYQSAPLQILFCEWSRLADISHVIGNTVGLVFFIWIYFRKLSCIRKLNPNENFCGIL